MSQTRILSHSVLLAAVAFSIGGCSIAPPSAANAPDAQVSAANLAAHDLGDADLGRMLETLGVPATAGAGVLTPGVVVGAALFFRADTKLAAADIAIARAALDAARELPNPVLSLGPEFVANAAAVPWVIAIAAALPIDTADKRGRRAEIADLGLQQAVLNASAILWQTRSRALAELQNLHDLENEAALLTEESEILDRTVAQLGKQQAAGLIGAPDVMGGRAALAQCESRRADVDARTGIARQTLAAAMGMPGVAVAGRAVQWPELAAVPALDPVRLDDLQTDAILNRMDLRMDLLAYARAQAQLRLELAKQMPNLTLGPGYTYDEGEHKIVMGLSLELPLFNRNEAAIAGAEARRSKAAATFTGTQAGIIAAVSSARAALDGSLAAWAKATAALEELRRARERTQAQLRGDVANRLDVLHTQLAEVQQRQVTLDVARQIHVAMAAMEDAVQAPIWSPELRLESALPPVAAMEMRGRQK